MAYTRTEYSRERDMDRDDHKQGGWRSWFGLDDKKDHDDGYNYASTTTYRNPQGYSGYSGEVRTGGYSGDRTSGYAGDRTSGYSGAISGGYGGPRGGYGYTTSDEVNRGPSYDREYYGNTRSGYGTSGDRDVYSKSETRTYGGDNWTSRNTGTPSRSYGFSGDNTRQYERDHPSTRDVSYTSRNVSSDYHPTTSRSYGFSSDNTRPSMYDSSRVGRDNDYSYTTSRTYPMTGDSSRYESRPEWSSSRMTTTGGDRDSYSYGNRTGNSGNTGYGYERDYTTTRSSRY